MTGYEIDEVESALLHALERQHNGGLSHPVFILGAPRTGSTAFYQAVINAFRLGYFCNLVNDTFASRPTVGVAVQVAVGRVPVAMHSRFGKTEGLWQPSEASSILQRWFGGRQPSQLHAVDPLPGAETHMRRCFMAAERLLEAPLVVKNAWNCFRAHALAEVFPEARFIWIRRDLLPAALSDLEARYLTKGRADEWNSATPANVAELRRLPPAAQVVENQYEFNLAIETGLTRLPPGRWRAIWYEHFCEDAQRTMNELADLFAVSSPGRVGSVQRDPARRYRLSPEEIEGVRRYVQAHGSRLGRFSVQHA